MASRAYIRIRLESAHPSVHVANVADVPKSQVTDVSQKTKLRDASMKPVDYKKALKQIANHFEGCDLDHTNTPISGNYESPSDASCKWVLSVACQALGWRILKTPDGEIYFDRTKEIESMPLRTAVDDGHKPSDYD